MSSLILGGTNVSGMSVAALLRVTAAIEVATAAALLILPGLTVALLFGPIPDTAPSMLLARMFGAPLLSLAVMCWSASSGPRDRAAPHVGAMLLYNVIVAALLVYAGTLLGLAGVALWPAVVAHALLAGWCVAALFQGGGRAPRSTARPRDESRGGRTTNRGIPPGGKRPGDLQSALPMDKSQHGSERTELMLKTMLLGCVVSMTLVGATKADPVDLSAYADANGFIDVQELTCAQLANTYQEDANALTTWYSGWYNGLAHKHFLDLKKGREAEHEVIVYCKDHPSEKIIHAIGVVFKDMRAEMGIKMK
jgi:HdeA/HdeB family